jgi:transposase-like protein
MSVLSRPEFYNEKAAYAYVEARIWPHGATCPKCGERDRVSKMGGKSTRLGAYKCYKCRKPFTMKVGTVFKASHVPMCLWLQAIYLMCASKKGISSNQLHRTLGVTIKTAWFMSHRIREAMRSDGGPLFGSGGGVVEGDGTFIGHKDKEATVYTDEARQYTGIGKHFADHDFATHSKGAYGRGVVHANTIEGYFSIFKRGMKGVCQHCDKKHLHRCAAKFGSRYKPALPTAQTI